MSAAHCITQKGYDRHRITKRPRKNLWQLDVNAPRCEDDRCAHKKAAAGNGVTTQLQECTMSSGIQSEHFLSTNRWSISRWIPDHAKRVHCKQYDWSTSIAVGDEWNKRSDHEENNSSHCARKVKIKKWCQIRSGSHERKAHQGMEEGASGHKWAAGDCVF